MSDEIQIRLKLVAAEVNRAASVPEPQPWVPTNAAISAAKFFGYSYEEWTTVRDYWEKLPGTHGDVHHFGWEFVRGAGVAIANGQLVSSWFWTKDEYPLDISISPENDARKARLIAADIYGIG